MSEETRTIDELIQELQAPFPIEDIQQRPMVVNKEKTAAIPANYIDARAVMERLDTVVGPFKWQRRSKLTGDHLFTEIGIRDPETGDWVWKDDTGTESNMEAEKGQASDSFKRAAVNWGIGRFLYGLGNTWVDGKAYNGKFRFHNQALQEYREQLSNLLTNGVMMNQNIGSNGKSSNNETRLNTGKGSRTKEQKEEILELVQEPEITREENNNTVKYVDDMSEKGADKVIRNLKATIKQRQQEKSKKQDNGVRTPEGDLLPENIAD